MSVDSNLISKPKKKNKPQSDLLTLVSFNPSKESIEKSQNVPIIPVGARAW